MKTIVRSGIKICSLLLFIMFTADVLLAQENERSALRFEKGRAVIRSGDQLLGSSYSETYPWDNKMNKRNQLFAQAGLNLFVLIADQKVPLDKQAKAIMEENPEAKFLVRMGPLPSKKWREQHKNHYPTGRHDKPTKRASLASEKVLNIVTEKMRNIVQKAESMDWSNRLLGYATLPRGEGITMHSIKGRLFDDTPVMERAFREHIKTTYEDDEALQEAWNDSSVSLENVTVPTDEEWREETEEWMHWPDPSETKRYRDYFQFVRTLYLKRVKLLTKTIHDASNQQIFCAYDGLKQPMMGWLIKDSFAAAAHGMDFPSLHLASGSIDLGPLMDYPHLDAVMTPADYTARSVGFSFEAEGVSDSMVLREKAMFIEDDSRSWTSSPGRSTQGAWRNEDEMEAGLLRNTGISITRGLLNYWMNVGKGFYEDPIVMNHIEKQIPLRRKLMKRPRVETEHAIAMIIDDTSPLWEDFTTGFQHLAVLRQRLNELALTGIPYRVYLLSDLKRNNFPKFRAYLFPNLFKLNQKRMNLIRKKVISQGSVAIFGPGTGIIDGNERSAENTSELLGIPMKLKKKETLRYVLTHGDHPAMKHVSGPMTYGDSYVYGPVLQPERDLKKATSLGKASMWFGSNRSGLVLREFGKGAAGNSASGDRGPGDGAVVFSVATPIPSEVLRSLAIYGGANPWSDLGDVVGAQANTVVVHSRRSGLRKIHLPRTATVTDLVEGHVIAEDTKQFQIELKAPATRIFGLSPVQTPETSSSR